MIYSLLESSLAIIGSIFILIASIGIVRMPDLFMRLQVTSKASVLGLTCILLALAMHFSNPVVTIRVGVIICFIVLTIPVATHMLARAGYATNVQLAEETIVNELLGQYDPHTHVLSGEEPVTWEIAIPSDAAAVGRRVAELGLPGDVLILSIHRRGEVVVPRGQTTIEAHDKLHILARPNELDDISDILGVSSPAHVQLLHHHP